jgi:hypothetical protein
MWQDPGVAVADFAFVREIFILILPCLIHFYYCFVCQVEVKIDSQKQDREHVSTLSIEAALYDNSGSSNSLDGDLSFANVVNLKPKPKPSRGPCLGFRGYILGGKIENPNLWSSEHVRNLIQGNFYCRTILLKLCLLTILPLLTAQLIHTCCSP